MNHYEAYLDIYTGNPGENDDRYMAPTNGRTSNYVVNPGVEGKVEAAIWQPASNIGNLSAFSTIDVIPYHFARDEGLFESPEAEEMYADSIESLFILRISSYPEIEEGLKLQIKVVLFF